MQQVITSLLLIALGMAVDAWYQRKLRIAECNAYETGYQQGKHEERIREEERAAQVGLVTVQDYPSMAAPVRLPETFGERLKKHGQATVWMNKQGGNSMNTVFEQMGALIRERDQAVEDIRALGRMGANICPLCAHYNHGEGGKQCIACPKMDNFAWRGLVKEG